MDKSFFHLIPYEILLDILCPLPVKTLIRVSSVCKLSYSLIRNPNFIKTHFDRSNSQPDNNENDGYILLIPKTPYISRYNCILHERSLDVHERFEFDFMHGTMYYLRIDGGFCNGLVCLNGSASAPLIGKKIFLYNPSLRKFKQLPSSSLADSIFHKDGRNHGGMRPPHVIGFGFDEMNNDYKVVSIFGGHHFEPEGEVYSLKTDSWKRIQVSKCEFGDKSVFVNGASHWLNRRKSDGIPNGIIAFDFCNEVFHEILFPDERSSEDIFLMRYNGLLSFAETWPFSVYDRSTPRSAWPPRQNGLSTRTRYNIWVMKEYGVFKSWTKQFTGEVEGCFLHVNGCTKNGDFLFLKDARLAAWDANNLTLVDSGIKYPHNTYNIVHDYRESLILIEDGKRFEDTS